jgi:hypothetical protein
MTYFREIPNLEYQSFLSDRKKSSDYILVKNIFRRVKLRDDLHNVLTIFDKYQIPDGSRPELVAEEVYGSAQYDWVVLISANITRVRDQWPLSDRDIYEYAENIYGTELNSIHHYETVEVRDSENKLILPAGNIVDSNFKIYYYDQGSLYTNDQTSLGEGVVSIANPIIGVSNYEYEVRKNDKKRTIYLLKPTYLQQAINDTRKAMTYDRSSQYVNEKIIRTENTRVTSAIG